MAYYETIYNTATPALDIMTNLQTWMPANGYTFVETYTSGTNISDVYKSPGTSNSFGTDFYIGFNRTSTTVASVGVMVFEQWDAVNKKPNKYFCCTMYLIIFFLYVQIHQCLFAFRLMQQLFPNPLFQQIEKPFAQCDRHH
jgi:hypothetical protein